MFWRLRRFRILIGRHGFGHAVDWLLRSVLDKVTSGLRGTDARTPPTLTEWLDAYGGIAPDGATPSRTPFSVVVPVYETPPALLDACVGSIVGQTHDLWELLLVDDGSKDPATARALARWEAWDERITVLHNSENLGIGASTNRGIEAASGEFVVFLDHDDELVPTALAWCAQYADQADLIYSDEYKIDEAGRPSSPFFKPAWSPRLLMGVNYVNHLTCIRTELVRSVGGVRPGFEGAQDHDLLLRIAETDPRVVHLPNLLYRWRAHDGSVAGRAGSKVEAERSGLRAVQESIDRRGWRAHAGLGAGSPFNYRVLWEPPADAPLVKVVLPTRDRLELLERAVNGVLERTDHVDVHLVIVDNGSEEDETLEYLVDLDTRDDVTVVRHDDAFNYSVLVNLGARSGPEAEFLLLLNNDVEIHHRRWLLQLWGWLDADPSVAAVGTKLRFPDETVQHAGIVMGLGGIAGHYALHHPEIPKLGNLHDQAREVGGVTAACMIVRTDAFEKVGGFNEDLGVDFQDVDFCLRLRHELGATIVYDPTYPLTHVQGATRGNKGASSPYTIARLRFLWGDVIDAGDPHYSPHFDLYAHDIRLGPIPEGRAERTRRIHGR